MYSRYCVLTAELQAHVMRLRPYQLLNPFSIIFFYPNNCKFFVILSLFSLLHTWLYTVFQKRLDEKSQLKQNKHSIHGKDSFNQTSSFQFSRPIGNTYNIPGTSQCLGFQQTAVQVIIQNYPRSITTTLSVGLELISFSVFLSV